MANHCGRAGPDETESPGHDEDRGYAMCSGLDLRPKPASRRTSAPREPLIAPSEQALQSAWLNLSGYLGLKSYGSIDLGFLFFLCSQLKREPHRVTHIFIGLVSFAAIFGGALIGLFAAHR